MNWEQIQGKWHAYKGQVKQYWGKLTDQDLTVINGKREVLIGKIMERTGVTKEQAEKDVAVFMSACKSAAPAAGAP